jgi:orotidine-5'-phosphate decarboxylase
MRPVDRLIVALDHASLAAALSQVDALPDEVTRYKVGLELFTHAGPPAVRELVARGKRVFLDLKLHDIPATAERAARAASELGSDLITVHASGGRAMLEGAVRGARAGGAARVLGVTVLTSLGPEDLRSDGSALELEALVLARARLAEAAGLDGVVASPREAAAIRAAVGPSFLVVTPGVRQSAAYIGEPSGARRGDSEAAVPPRMSALIDDQKRTATAREARQAGADLVVVGRPIRDAADPRAVVAALVAELG